MGAFKCEMNVEGHWREKHMSLIPEGPGIYFVYESRYDEASETICCYRLVFIGEAEDLRQEVNNHPELAFWKNNLRAKNELSFSVAQYGGTERQRIRSAYVCEHKPVFNHVSEFRFSYLHTIIISWGNLGLLEPVIDLCRQKNMENNPGFYENTG